MKPGSLLSHLPPPPMPEDLAERAYQAILQTRVRELRNRLFLTLGGFFLSFGYAVSHVSAMWSELQTSSFVSFLRLAFSDSDVVLSHWRELFFALVGSFPIVSALLVLLCLFFLAGSALFGTSLRSARRDALHPSFT